MSECLRIMTSRASVSAAHKAMTAPTRLQGQVDRSILPRNIRHARIDSKVEKENGDFSLLQNILFLDGSGHTCPTGPIHHQTRRHGWKCWLLIVDVDVVVATQEGYQGILNAHCKRFMIEFSVRRLPIGYRNNVQPNAGRCIT